MPKYVIPFVDNTHWKTCAGCVICQAIDKSYNQITKERNSFVQQKLINQMEDILVDGYKLLEVDEKNGFAISKKEELEKIKTYVGVTNLFMERVNHYFDPNYKLPLDISHLDDPVLTHSRWCRYCGSRKPDIYNSNLVGLDDLTSILNFKVELKNEKAYINWSDISANNWHHSKLIKKVNIKPENDTDVIVVAEYANINKFASTPCIDPNIVPGNIFYYQVYSYDVLNNIIASTDPIPLLWENINYKSPKPITDFEAVQQRHIEIINEIPIIKDYIVAKWNNPEEYNGVDIRYNLDYDTPDSIRDGFPTEVKSSINIGYDNYSKLLLGNTYCFKPFPYKAINYTRTADGIEYISSKDYNLSSKSAYIRISQHVELPVDINVITGDGNISINWKDTDNPAWKSTKIYYKRGGMILSEDDPGAVLYFESTDRNAYVNTPLVINGLKNNNSYFIGIFSVSNENLCNININCQRMVTPKFEKEDIIINFDDPSYKSYMPIMNNWYIQSYEHEKILHSPEIHGDGYDYISMFQYGLKRGGRLSFKYLLINHKEDDNTVFTILLNGKEVYLTEKFVWATAIVPLPITEYLNIKFLFKSSYTTPVGDCIMIKDMKIAFS